MNAPEIPMNEIQLLLQAGNFFLAVEQIQRDGTPTEIASRFNALVNDLYWKARDLPAVVAIGRAGILFCLTQSSITETPKEMIDKLRSTAKGMAYNVGSFTWPGWEEPGINPLPGDLAAGRECARLNLRLAIELNKPVDRISTAHWLLGAHALANHDLPLAENEFHVAVDLLDNEPAHSLIKYYHRGCLALARIGLVADDAAQLEFDKITSYLAGLIDPDAKSYLTQLHAVRRLFVQPQ